MATRVARRGARQAPRRKMVWARRGADGANITTTASSVNLLDNFELEYAANLIGATVVRIRGVMMGFPAALTDTSTLRVAATVDLEGQAASPSGPFDSPYRDWMMWEPFLHNGTTTAQTQGPHGSRVIDVKAMRKLEEINEQLTLWTQVSPGDGAWSLSYDLSILLKLP